MTVVRIRALSFLRVQLTQQSTPEWNDFIPEGKIFIESERETLKFLIQNRNVSDK